jgi:hypothetical protein
VPDHPGRQQLLAVELQNEGVPKRVIFSPEQNTIPEEYREIVG